VITRKWPSISGATLSLVAMTVLFQGLVHAQIRSSDGIHSQPIELVDLSHGSTKAAGLNFAAGEADSPNLIVLAPDETAAISPNAVLAAILKFAKPGEPSASVRIFDQSGTEIRAHDVAPFDQIAIADDGRIALYGGEPTTEEAGWSRLQFYASDGRAIAGTARTFGPSPRGMFSEAGDLFVFLAHEDADLLQTCPVVLLLFDVEFRITGEHRFVDWSLHSPLRPLFIDEERRLVELHRSTGVGTELVKETVYLDFTGRIQDTRGGWER